jgi:hypothetical protein
MLRFLFAVLFSVLPLHADPTRLARQSRRKRSVAEIRPLVTAQN